MSETEKLIALVKEKRYLYDLNDRNYKNRLKRTKTWQEIATIMGEGDGNIWSNKWKGLRDNYAKYKKTSDPFSGLAYKKYKNWPWAELMKFLDDCNSFGSRRSHGSHCDNTNNLLSSTDQTQDTKYCNVQLFIPDANVNSSLDESHDPVPEGSENYTSETKKKKMKTRIEPTAEVTEYHRSNSNEHKSKLDGVDHFFLSYAQSFKKLPNRMQIMLKLEIATLFSRYELQAEGFTSDSINNMSRIVPHPVKCEYEFTNTIEDE